MAVNKKQNLYPAEISIEQMTLQDLPDVLAIERASFPIPFTEHLFRMELNLDVANLFVARLRVSGGRFPAAANGENSDAQMGGSGGERSSPLGYIDYWKVQDEIHLITIAVHPDWRHLSIGSRMLTHMIEDSRARGGKQATLDVRPSNTAAIALYRKFGFREVGVRKRYYQDNGEDALVMALDLSGVSEASV